jgi:hypothetical protein
VDASKQLAEVPQREPLTEAEARVLGASAQRLAKYRYLLSKADKGGSINVAPGDGKLVGENLGSASIQAVLGFLIDREKLLLSSLGVVITEDPHDAL